LGWPNVHLWSYLVVQNNNHKKKKKEKQNNKKKKKNLWKINDTFDGHRREETEF